MSSGPPPSLQATRTLGDDERFDDPGAQTEPSAPWLVGRYVIVERLGAGGMGAVYTAYDPELDRRVALKVLHPHRDSARSGSTGRMRLLREAQAIAKVSHPNVVVVYDAGVAEIDGDPQVFLAMERIEGRTLRRWMADEHDSDGFAAGQRTLAILEVLRQAARGLAAAHDAGIVHRDFKPENVLIGDDGVTRVADFGLARRIASDPSRADEPPDSGNSSTREATSTPVLDARVTETGALLGTPAYMSPEQFLGTELDARTDQFSFCATAYEALLGARPFPGETTPKLTVAVMEGRLREPPKAPVLPERVLAALHRGLSRKPEDRFDSMHALLEALADPMPASRRWVALGVAALGAGGAIWAAAQDAPPTAQDPCAAGQARVAEVYGQSDRAAIEDALVDASLAWSRRVSDTVRAELDAYASAWAEGHRAACEASHVRHEQTGALLDARMACLDRRLSALEITVDALSGAEADVRENAVPLVTALPALAPCSDVAALQSGVALPADEAARERVAKARRAIEAAHAAEQLHRGPTVLELVEQAQRDTADLDYPPLAAELRSERGQALALVGRHDDARTELEGAVWDAQAAGFDEIVLGTAQQLGALTGIQLHDPETGLKWLRLAEATNERLGDRPQKKAALLATRAWVLVEWKHAEQAIEVAEQALAAAERAYAPDSTKLAQTLSMVGAVYGRLGQSEPARDAFDRAKAISLEKYGRQHPQMLKVHLNLGNAQAALHSFEEARTNLEAAVAIADELPDVNPGLRASVHNSLGNLLMGEGEYEDSQRALEVALELRLQIYGPDHPLVARTLNGLGYALKELGHYDDALEHYLRSLEIREAQFGTDHPEVFFPLNNIGAVLVLAERPDDALPYLERGLALLEAHPTLTDPYRAASHRDQTGRVLYDTGTDRPRGVALVRDALRRFKDANETESADKAEAWLAEHG